MKYLLLHILIVLLMGFIAVSCGDETPNTSQLELLESFAIDVPEPSGLAINSSGNILYTVSDNTNKVYKLSTSGVVLQTYNFTGNDLEGICRFTDDRLLLAEERTKTIVELMLATGQSTGHIMNYENNEANSGMEGITFNETAQKIYFLNEKDPGKLFVLNTNFSIENNYNLSFANDYSGIYYDTTDDLLWIISDQSQSINKCSLTGDLIESYTINVQKPEGIAIANNKIYIVSDSQERLFVFTKPD